MFLQHRSGNQRYNSISSSIWYVLQNAKHRKTSGDPWSMDWHPLGFTRQHPCPERNGPRSPSISTALKFLGIPGALRGKSGSNMVQMRMKWMKHPKNCMSRRTMIDKPYVFGGAGGTVPSIGKPSRFSHGKGRFFFHPSVPPKLLRRSRRVTPCWIDQTLQGGAS